MAAPLNVVLAGAELAMFPPMAVTESRELVIEARELVSPRKS
ncbi:hypothetical protein MGAST_16585 [Mycobacterium gastri 'Wayne']|nr:hypothetical protein MGAST_16585 [Mycobacterium gastri 'Wayne']